MERFNVDSDTFLDQIELDDRISSSMTICPICGDEYAAILNHQMTCGNPMCDETYNKDMKRKRSNGNKKKSK
jgi:predicted nucleic acid-binding Zn ribbon protein